MDALIVTLLKLYVPVPDITDPEPFNVMVLVLPSIVPELSIFPVILWPNDEALNVVDAPIVTFPEIVTILAALIAREVPVVDDVKFPAMVKSVAGKVLMAVPVVEDNIRLP